MIKSIENISTVSKKVLASGMLVATLVVAGLSATPPTYASTTFTVENIDDPGDGLCNAQGCTLRDAIIAANATPNSGGPDLIRFNIAGTGVKTINLTSQLPTITDPVVIDGYTQGDATENTLAKGTNAKLLIQLDGTNAGSLADGLNIARAAGGTTVRGLVINHFKGDGMQIVGAAKVEGNFIGTDPSGTIDFGNS